MKTPMIVVYLGFALILLGLVYPLFLVVGIAMSIIGCIWGSFKAGKAVDKIIRK